MQHRDSDKSSWMRKTRNIALSTHVMADIGFSGCHLAVSEIFPLAMDNLLEGLEGVHCYVDDRLVWGATLLEHSGRLTKVLKSLWKWTETKRCQMSIWCTQDNILGWQDVGQRHWAWWEEDDSYPRHARPYWQERCALSYGHDRLFWEVHAKLVSENISRESSFMIPHGRGQRKVTQNGEL